MCFIFHELWRSNVRFFGKLLYTQFLGDVLLRYVHRQSKYCNILLIVNFRTKYIGKDILYFSKKSIDIRHQTYQLHLLKRSVCKPFIFLTLNCLVKFSTQTTTKKNVSPAIESNHLISTFNQSFHICNVMCKDGKLR